MLRYVRYYFKGPSNLPYYITETCLQEIDNHRGKYFVGVYDGMYIEDLGRYSERIIEHQSADSWQKTFVFRHRVADCHGKETLQNAELKYAKGAFARKRPFEDEQRRNLFIIEDLANATTEDREAVFQQLLELDRKHHIGERF